ncbi:uncharacterized protein LOC143449570 [Clavelina lepadiformis]|uniref:uncharacterized protein LOC143449570 n=1 Tax=Clavelina lepadiformis TaxID=159417 RepID=UPI004042CCB7
MSTIEKLIISGIRSFGSNDETIEFQRPLTLLVGPNGAGKTTIIECLKFGITGGKPCDYKYFNNPKVVREEFPSKVKLQIRNQIGKQIEIERNTWFKNKIAKSKATINWEGKSISPKSKDAKDLLAELIDVSEPILNYIVFCHQENSNWPINTGNKLKTTFDSIFNLDRYNEALKNIRSKQQEYKTQAANVETDIKNLEEKRNEAHKCRKELEDTEEKMKNVVGDIHKNQIELDNVEKELSDLTKQKKKVQSLDNEIENLINKKEAKVETCKFLDSRITKIDNVSDEDLHKMHSEIVSKVKKLSVWKKDLIAEEEEKQKPISTTITKLRTELDLLLKQERENVYSRDQKIRNYAEKSRILLSDAALSEDEIVRFREEFEANTAMQVEKLRKQKDKDAKDLENAQEDFRQKDEAKTKLQVKSDDLRRRLEELVQKQDQVKQRLLENKSIEETTNWDEMCNKLAEAQKELDEEKLKTKLSLLNGDLEELKVKRKLHKCNVDLTDSALKEALKSTLARSKLQLLQEQLKEKDDLLKILKEDGKQLLTSETETNFLSMSYSDLMNRKREIDKETENISSKLEQIGQAKLFI